MKQAGGLVVMQILGWRRGAAVERAGWRTCGRADAQAGAVSGLQMERQEVSMTNARESVGQPAGGRTSTQVGWWMAGGLADGWYKLGRIWGWGLDKRAGMPTVGMTKNSYGVGVRKLGE